MLKIAKRHPILLACALVAIVTCALIGLFTTRSPVALFALSTVAAACFVGAVMLNDNVFGAGSNSTIYRPGAHPDDDRP